MVWLDMIFNIFILIVAILHLYFLVLEMFFWTRPLGIKVFKMSHEKAVETAALAANQGLYNGFLAAGLLWSLFYPEEHVGHQIALFFLVCVTVAGIYGAYSVNRKIFFIQSLPALLAILSLCF
jgi:putative membrane protein